MPARSRSRRPGGNGDVAGHQRSPYASCPRQLNFRRVGPAGAEATLLASIPPSAPLSAVGTVTVAEAGYRQWVPAGTTTVASAVGYGADRGVGHGLHVGRAGARSARPCMPDRFGTAGEHRAMAGRPRRLVIFRIATSPNMDRRACAHRSAPVRGPAAAPRRGWRRCRRRWPSHPLASPTRLDPQAVGGLCVVDAVIGRQQRAYRLLVVADDRRRDPPRGRHHSSCGTTSVTSPARSASAADR